jgi:hypothetical protein
LILNTYFFYIMLAYNNKIMYNIEILTTKRTII